MADYTLKQTGDQIEEICDAYFNGQLQASEDLTAEITEYGSLNDELEEVINSLPDAGGGGASLKTCELTVTGATSYYYPTKIAYVTVDDSGNIAYANETVTTASKTVTCLQNSIVAVMFGSNFNSTSSDTMSEHLLFYNGSLAIFKIEEEDSVTLNNNVGSSGGGLD